MISTEAVDKAVELVRAHLDVGMAVILTREDEPNAVPEYGETATIDGICRRIVGALLNEGWTPPEPREPTMPKPMRREDVPAELVEIAAEAHEAWHIEHSFADTEPIYWESHRQWVSAVLAAVLPVAREKGLVTLWGSPEEIERRRNQPRTPDDPAEVQRRLRESLGHLGVSIECVLIDHARELGDDYQGADALKDLAHAYERVTGWTVAEETRDTP